MRRLATQALATMVMAAVAIQLSAPASQAAQTPPTAVVTVAGAFDPARLEVPPGTVVVWKIEDNDRHRIRSRGPDQFDSGNLHPGDSYSFQFDTQGQHPYYDQRHDGYEGVVVVTDNPTTEPPTEPPSAPQPAPEPAPSPLSDPNTVAVAIRDDSFKPSTITVSVGDTIVWTQYDNDQHTVTASDGSLDSPILGENDRYQQTLTAVGTINYICVIHPKKMKGTVVVEAASGDPQPPPPTEPPPEPPTETQPQPTQPADPPTEPTEPSPAPPAPKTRPDIGIVDFAFQPSSTVIQTGDTIVWANQGDAPHTVTWQNGSGSDLLWTADTYQQTFTQPGTYNYLCTLHPQMTATITVKDTPTAAANPPPNNQTNPPTPTATQTAIPPSRLPISSARSTQQTPHHLQNRPHPNRPPPKPPK